VIGHLRLALLGLPFFLTSCFSLNPYSSKFSCPGYRPGVCASIPDVYRAYKRGELLAEPTESADDFTTYAPLKCRTETVCKLCPGQDVCSSSVKKCCKTYRICEKQSVKKYTDYRAEAVKDNAPKEEVVW